MARAGQPGTAAMDGSSSHRAAITPTIPDPGPYHPVHLADRPQGQGPVQPGSDQQAERLAEHGPADQQQHRHRQLGPR